MDCLGENTVVAFLEGRLQGAERHEIHAHVRACAVCNGLFAALAQTTFGELARGSQTPAGSLASAVLERSLDEPTFAPGERVAERYEVVRFIARGGMGEVYEVQDLALGERVALKTLRAGGPQSAESVELFKRELQLARKVTHPNVCRVFDVGFHRGGEMAGGQGAETVFLTMELLGGETLSARLRRVRRMTEAEALPLVRQMAAALGAAHRAGIVHRDFKSENVFLVPDASEEGGSRVVVTDFGLAHRASGEGGVGGGAIVGTPVYMAPEQVEGGPITPAADIYALGVVLYELVTGEWPFRAATPMKTAMLRLEQPPPSPREKAPELELRWEVAILRCLSREPEERFARAAEVAEAVAMADASRGRRIWLAVTAAALAAAVAAGIGIRSHRHRAAQRAATAPAAATTAPALPAPSQGHVRPSVAVLGFKNLSGRPDKEWLSTAFAQLLTDHLAAGGALRVSSQEEVSRAEVDLALSDFGAPSGAELAKLRVRLGVDDIVAGSYAALDSSGAGNIELSAVLEDARTGEILTTASQRGREESLFAIAQPLADGFRVRLDVAREASSETGAVRVAIPANPEAARLYAQGLVQLHAYGYGNARTLLERAEALDPGNPLIHGALEEVLDALGWSRLALEEAKKALDSSGGMERERRLAIEATYDEEAGRWERAIEIWKALRLFAPDDLGYGLELAFSQGNGESNQAELKTLDELRKTLPPQVSGDPRLDLYQAETEYSIGDYARAEASTQRAISKAKATGARHVLADAEGLRGHVLQGRGKLEEARAVLESSEAIYRSLGDSKGAAIVMLLQGDLLDALGRSGEAQQIYQRVLALYRGMGSSSGILSALDRIGAAYLEAGDARRAKEQFERALELSRSTGGREAAASELENLGAALVMLRDFPEAKQRLEEALAAWHDLVNLPAEAATRANLGGLLQEQGDLAGARLQLEGATAIRRKLGAEPDLAQSLVALGNLAVIQGRLAEAEKGFAEARAIGVRTSDRSAEATGDLGLAQVQIERGEVDRGTVLARSAGKELEEAGMFAQAGDALDAAADALLKAREVSEARQAVDQAAALHKKAGDAAEAPGLLLELARVQAAEGHEPEALSGVRKVLAGAVQSGDIEGQLDARLALGEIQLPAGQLVGRATLAALAKDAKAKGFLLVAREATEAASAVAGGASSSVGGKVAAPPIAP